MSAQDLINDADESAFSHFEKTDKGFRDFVKDEIKYASDEQFEETLNGRNVPFCFKQCKNAMDNEKNQVHTRALHAEENAFLQLARPGSIGVDNGILFTTSSPCELCGKKAYQLGIKEIYYINLYPGITENHIIESGRRRPKMHLFKGVIGKSFFKLYTPFTPFKDELEMVTGVKIKKSK